MIEYLSQSKKVESRKLYEEVFPEDTKEFLDYYYNHKVENHKVLVKNLENDVVGMLHCNPHLLSIKENQEEVDYIYAVATKKEHRGKGIMRELLVKVLNDMYKEGKAFTYLIPVAEKIYSPYGFSYVSDKQKMVVERRGLLKAASINIMTLLNSDDTVRIDELIEFSKRMLGNERDVFSYRNHAYYQDLLAQLKLAAGHIELLYEEDRLLGYCYLVREDELSIIELVCHEEDMDSFVQGILEKYVLDKISISGILVKEEHNLTTEKEPFIMARILNLKNFFSLITSEEEVEVVIEITDPVIKGNNGVYLWKCNKTGSILQRSNVNPSYKFTISDLTSWLFGYQAKSSKMLVPINVLAGVFINEEV